MSELVERFQRLHRDSPDRPLIHLPFSSVSITVDGVHTAALEQRRALERLGLARGSLVMMTIGNRPAAFPFWLACRAAGIVVMPVDAGATSVEIVELARRFGVDVAIVPDLPQAVPALGTPEPFCDGLLAFRLARSGSEVDRYHGAVALKLTSGSTGLPKATFTTEAELIADSEHILEAMEIGTDDIQVAAIPLSHAYGLGVLLVPALIQGTAVVLREGFVPHALPADARACGATVFPGVPFMYDHFAAAAPGGGWPPTLRKLVSAGARLEPLTVRRFFDAFGVKVHSFYGTSETGGIAFDDGDDVRDDTTVGRPLPGVRISLRPDEEAPPDGGRVHVTSAAVATRYAGEDPGDGGFVDGGYLTGDFGRFDTAGQLVLTGRASLFINVAGRKVQPEEVEQVLRTMPSIADVRVLGAPDTARGQQIVACVVSKGADRNVLAVRQYCAARLAVHKLPRRILWLDRIPLTPRGKTDRALLEVLIREQLARPVEPGML